ncbi:MAG: endonuclease/exonuclease/phosphatase family protein [Alphaproteobacteria bacterium]
MIAAVEAAVRRLRRAASRSEWFARALRLPVSTEPETAAGLVMIQIDGLSRREFERGMVRREMPFLRRLLDREDYRVHDHYSGVPSSTAPVQGELFYGVRTGVPGFSFLDRASGRLVRMYEPTVAARVERELEAKGGTPLLQGGSAYSDNFTGGAAEPHFCPSALGWGPSLRAASRAVIAVFVFAHIYSIVRVASLLLLEFVLAVVDFIRGLVDGRDIIKELKFIPTRLAIVILLRELVTIGAKIDLARGLPIVHVNFLGYDEQAHRRGPASLFAHWTLRGIDDAVARIWRAAQRSKRRQYDVWIYSDHGQEPVLSYEKAYGRTFASAVAEVFSKHEGRSIAYRSAGHRGGELQRARFLGGDKVQRLFPVGGLAEERSDSPELAIASLGPLAMVYYERQRPAAELGQIARSLANDAHAPLVLAKDDKGRARVWSDAGEFLLPRDKAVVLGAEHPFLDAATRDLVDLCHHADAGDFVISGWRPDRPAYSFAVESGAHGGAGPNETGAFALLPSDAVLPEAGPGYLRPADLRRAAQQFLGRAEPAPTPARGPAQPGTIRLMTYNVHSCIGMDGTLSPERIARVIARAKPNIVALQELDVGRARTMSVDQAHRIASCLEMDVHFHPTMHVEEGEYGNAILSNLPMRLVKAEALPGVILGKTPVEPRGAIWVAIEVDNIELQLFNTHLGLLPNERRRQAAALLGPDWLSHPDCVGPVVLCGDFNALPRSAVCRRLGERLRDAQDQLEGHRPKGTFFGRYAGARIDHIFVDPRSAVVNIVVPNTTLDRVASDHLPLVADIALPA